MFYLFLPSNYSSNCKEQVDLNGYQCNTGVPLNLTGIKIRSSAYFLININDLEDGIKSFFLMTFSMVNSQAQYSEELNHDLTLVESSHRENVLVQATQATGFQVFSLKHNSPDPFQQNFLMFISRPSI